MEAVANNRSATEQLRDKAAQVKTDIRELGVVAKDAAAEKFDSWYKDGREKIVKLEKGLENKIREYPIQSVLIAAGTGFLAGYLVSRRR